MYRCSVAEHAGVVGVRSRKVWCKTRTREAEQGAHARHGGAPAPDAGRPLSCRTPPAVAPNRRRSSGARNSSRNHLLACSPTHQPSSAFSALPYPLTPHLRPSPRAIIPLAEPSQLPHREAEHVSQRKAEGETDTPTQTQSWIGMILSFAAGDVIRADTVRKLIKNASCCAGHGRWRRRRTCTGKYIPLPLPSSSVYTGKAPPRNLDSSATRNGRSSISAKAHPGLKRVLAPAHRKCSFRSPEKWRP